MILRSFHKAIFVRTEASTDHNCYKATLTQISTYGDKFESMLGYVAGICQLDTHSRGVTEVFNTTAKDGVTDACVSSNYYTTKQDDTCGSIALSHRRLLLFSITSMIIIIT